MRGQAGFFDVDERLKELSAKGDQLERLSAIVNFELFRPDLVQAVPRSDGLRGGRPPFDATPLLRVVAEGKDRKASVIKIFVVPRRIM